MATVKINGNAIWIKHIEGSESLRDRIRSLRADDILELEVDGIVGQWQRMRDGRDGRPTFGIKPISQSPFGNVQCLMRLMIRLAIAA